MAPRKTKENLPPSFRLGKSVVTDDLLDQMAKRGLIIWERASAPAPSEVVPCPRGNQIIVFADYFEVGLRLPCSEVLERILFSFEVDLCHLSPNAFVRLESYIWSLYSEHFSVTAMGFSSTHVCVKKPKVVVEGDEEKELQFGSCYFDNRSRREQPVRAYKNHSGKQWWRRWFYHEVPESSRLHRGIRPINFLRMPKYQKQEAADTAGKVLRRVQRNLGVRELFAEFRAAGIFPLAAEWPLQIPFPIEPLMRMSWLRSAQLAGPKALSVSSPFSLVLFFYF
jgi:Putative gypsy type transposon